MVVLDMVIYCIAGYTIGHWLGMIIIKCIERNRKKKAKEIRLNYDVNDFEVRLVAQKIVKELNKDKIDSNVR